MTYQHCKQADGRWDTKPFLEQVANIGSEVERTINWRKRGNEEYSKAAFQRSLELFDLTLGSRNISFPQRKEIARAREAWVDFIAFDNQYCSNAELWKKYFMQLLVAYKSCNFS
jgi:hypothetical protein